MGLRNINTLTSKEIIDKLNNYLNFPEYIIDFFKDINTKIDDDEEYNYINNFESFNGKLNKKLTKNINKFLELIDI